MGSPPPGGGTTFDDGVRVRPPDSADVAAAMATDDPAATILERCVEPDLTSLPERARAAAIRRMAEPRPRRGALARGDLPSVWLDVDGAARSRRDRRRGGRPARATGPPRGRPACPRLRLARAGRARAEPGSTPGLPRAGGVVSGYLERLVGRHVEPPAVRPRPVSRFEGDLVGGAVQSRRRFRTARRRAAPAEPAQARPAPSVDASASRRAAPRGPAVERAQRRLQATGPALSGAPRPPVRSRRRPPANRGARPARPSGRATTIGHAPRTRSAYHRRRHSPSRAALCPPPRRRPWRRRPGDRPSPARASRMSSMSTSAAWRSGRPSWPQAPRRPATRPTRPAPMSLERYLAGERRT